MLNERLNPPETLGQRVDPQVLQQGAGCGEPAVHNEGQHPPKARRLAARKRMLGVRSESWIGYAGNGRVRL